MSINIKLLSVSNGAKSNIRICLYGQWLPDMGFIPGALVRAVPEPGGVTFTLCGGSFPQNHGGKFIQVPSTNGRKVKCPVLATTGKYLCETGLSHGEPLIASYSPGFIRIRRCPVMAKAVIMTDNHIRLVGSWLAESGFHPDTVALASPGPGRIVVNRHGEALAAPPDYAGLVRFARQNKMKIVQFSHYGKAPCVSISGLCVDKAGFSPGDALIAHYGHDQIVIQKLDFAELGF